MRFFWLTLVLLLCLGAAAQAAERSPAALIPADVGLYLELNLAPISGEGPTPSMLSEAISLSKVMSVVRTSTASNPEVGKTVDQVLTAVSATGKALGWRVGCGLAMDPSALMTGGQPKLYVVASVPDPAAATQAVQSVLEGLKVPVLPTAAHGDMTALKIAKGPAILSQGKDWVALTLSVEGAADIDKLATGARTTSLAASEDFQRAVAVLPENPLVLEYTSGALLKQSAAMATLALPQAHLDNTPEHGTAWAMALQAEEVKGRKVLRAVYQMDLDTAAYFLEGPLATAVTMAMPTFSQAQSSERKTQCLSNVKQLATAMNIYVADHGKFPKADQWVSELEEYLGSPDALKCPDDPSEAKCSYGMNWALSGKPLSSVKNLASKVVIYETAHPGDCPRGNKSDVASPPRHDGGNTYGYADGHAKWLSESGKPTSKQAW